MQVLRNLQTMAESTERLRMPAKEAHPEWIWYKFSGFRKRAGSWILGCGPGQGLDNRVERDLPDLKAAIISMIK